MKGLGAAVFALVFTTMPGFAQDALPYEGFSKVVYHHMDFAINPDATYVETQRYAVKVLDKKGIDDVNTQSVTFSDALTDMTVLEAYTLKQDGRRIDVPPNNFQVESNQGEDNADPMFSDLKTKSVAFPDVSAGDTVVFAYRLTQKEALFPGHFSLTEWFGRSHVQEDTRLRISAPASMYLKVEARGVEGGELAASGGKHTWEWRYANREIERQQTSAVSPFDYAPRVVASTFKDYGELAKAYESRAAAKAVVTPRITQLAEEITRGVDKPRDQAKALYDWVAGNIHYAGNCIGVGSVVPHDTNRILDNKLGDCKDHTALLQALLAAKGIESTPALVNSGGIYTLPDVPVVSVFNHVINYLPSLNLYADSTSEHTPFGMLPIAEEGKPVIHTARYTGIQHTPLADPKSYWTKTRADIHYRDDGGADGEVTYTLSGRTAIGARLAFQSMNPNHAASQFRDMLARQGYKGSGQYVRIDDPAVEKDSFSYAARFHVEDALNLPGPGAIYVSSLLPSAMPIGNFLSAATAETPRHDFICGGGVSEEEVVLHLPKTVKVLAVPRDQHLNSPSSRYDATYRRKGNTVASTRKIEDATHDKVCKPEQLERERPFAVQARKDLRAQVVYQ